MPEPAYFYISEEPTYNSVTIEVIVGDSTQFRIFVRPEPATGSSVWDKTVSRSSNFTYTVTGLEPNTDYAINVHYNNGDAWCGAELFTTAAMLLEPWEWWTTIEKGKPFVPPTAKEWNAFTDHINAFLEYFGVAPRDFTPAIKGKRMMADTANAARSAIGALGDYRDTKLDPGWLNSGDPITAAYFHGLRDYLNSALEAI